MHQQHLFKKENTTTNTAENISEDKDLNHIIRDLQNYMFTSKNIVKYLKNLSFDVNGKSENGKFENGKSENGKSENGKSGNGKSGNGKSENGKNMIETIIPIKKIKNTIFTPTQKDTLFWCLFVIKHGIDKYEMLDNTHFIVEKQEKFKYIELIRSKKDVLKMHKIKPLSELEDDLANKDKISIKTFIALSILEGSNIMVLQNRKIFESINNDDKFIHMIQKSDNQTQRFFYDENHDETKMTYYRENYFKLDTIDHKIKTISSYTLQELMDISKKLGINHITDKKMQKKELYESIVLHY